MMFYFEKNKICIKMFNNTLSLNKLSYEYDAENIWN